MALWLRVARWIALAFASLSAAQSNQRTFPRGWSPFKTLGLPESQNMPKKAPLKRAHRKASMKWHPDKCKEDAKKCEKKMAAVNVANEVLSDKKEFHNWLGQKNGGSRHTGGGGNPFGGGGGNPFGGGGNPFGGGGGGGGFPGFNFNFGGGGQNPFGGGGHGARPGGPRRQAKPPPPPPPRPSPRPRPVEKGWKTVKSVEERRGRSTVTTITRELPVPGGKQIKVELLEKTCYDAQKECIEKVVERWRRKKDEL